MIISNEYLLYLHGFLKHQDNKSMRRYYAKNFVRCWGEAQGLHPIKECDQFKDAMWSLFGVDLYE